MACGYCEKVEGLPKVDHVLNTKGKQVYRCPLCTEYIVETKITAMGGVVGAGAPVPLSGAGFNFARHMAPAFGIKIPQPLTAAQANATPIKETKKPDTATIAYCGYDPAGIERMLVADLHLVDPDRWYIKEAYGGDR